MLQRYRASDLRDKCCLVTEFTALRMEPGEEPTKSMMRVDERQVGKKVDEDEKHITILNGLTQENTIEP